MNLVVEDDYITDTGSYFGNNYKLYNEYVKEYIDILKEITENGIVSGQTHDALVEFQQQVATSSGVQSSSAEALGKKYNTYCTEFISDLDKADGDLY